MFSAEFGSDARKFLKKAEKEVARRILEKIEKLKIEPFPSGVKRIVGKRDKIFRVRVGDYRITYTVIYEQNLILITDIDKRSKIYD